MKTQISCRLFLETLFMLTVLFRVEFVEVQNPIGLGLSRYGIRGCQVTADDGKYYMTGTEISHFGEEKQSITLYESRDMKKCKAVKLMV